MFSAFHHEIASMLAFTDVRIEELEKGYGADVLEDGRDEIELMRKCLAIERAELIARGMARSTTSPGIFLESQADWTSVKVVFAMGCGAWMPTDLWHLKYVLFRAELHGFSEKFAADIRARIHAAEATLAVASILRRQG